MKFSESWLREWVNPNASTQQIVDQLTMAGLEVDAVEPVAGTFSGVIVGEIVDAQQHPDADKLRVCKVAGLPEGETQVVCGAPNARVGLKIPFATVGASLPPGEDGKPFKIKKAKLRGVESFGMLCGQTELQAGDDDEGLWELPADAPVGQDLREYLSLNDNLIEVDPTPNRSDCLSIKGLARELGVLSKIEVTAPVIAAVEPQISDVLSVTLSAGSACSRYVGRVIKGIDIAKPSPLWLQEKLRRSGIRSIDAVVDVTNYVLIELGQPMHAFDLAKINGGINVRLANAKEELTLLNDQKVELKEDTLVIADESGALAMAGIMGGEASAVTSATQDIFLESAFFEPIAIAGRARSYGLHTDSSHRFERGVDYNGAQAAIERATALLLEIVGGQAGPVIVAESQQDLPSVSNVNLSKARIESGLGFAIPDVEVEDILTRLGLKLVESNESGWTFAVPSYRFDVAIEADLLEELARIYGYNNLPTTTVRIPAQLPSKTETVTKLDRIKDHLASRGYREVITYSFVDPALQNLINGEQANVPIINPISSDMGIMRTSLLPGLLNTLSKNVKRQVQRVRIFESGLTFVAPEGMDSQTLEGLTQPSMFAGLIYGARAPVGWHADKDDVDFYDIKGDLESLLAFTGQAVTFESAEVKALHPYQTAKVKLAGAEIGYIGALHPEVAKQLDLPKAAYVFEVSLDAIKQAKVPAFTALSRYPEVARDLAIVVDKGVNGAALEAEIRSVAGDYLKNLKIFDVYSGKGIDPQRKSIAFNLIFQHPSRTLTEDEISAPMAEIVKKLEQSFNAQLR